jgi:hypothetical protein
MNIGTEINISEYSVREYTDPCYLSVDLQDKNICLERFWTSLLYQVPGLQTDTFISKIHVLFHKVCLKDR